VEKSFTDTTKQETTSKNAGITAFFPGYYCTFEQIEILHSIYFLLYNVICMVSLVYTKNDHEKDME